MSTCPWVYYRLIAVFLVNFEAAVFGQPKTIKDSVSAHQNQLTESISLLWVEPVLQLMLITK